MGNYDAWLLTGQGGPDDDPGLDEPDEDDENDYDTPLVPNPPIEIPGPTEKAA